MFRHIIFLVQSFLIGYKRKKINSLSGKITIEQYLQHKHPGLPDKLREKFKEAGGRK